MCEIRDMRFSPPRKKFVWGRVPDPYANVRTSHFALRMPCCNNTRGATTQQAARTRFLFSPQGVLRLETNARAEGLYHGFVPNPSPGFNVSLLTERHTSSQAVSLLASKI